MNFPPKAISILLLVQCLFIWMGHGLTRKMLRMLEQSELRALAQHMPSSASFVLGFGLWALLIPLFWASWVGLRSEAHQGILMAQSNDTKITIGLTIVIACVWSYAAMQSMNMAFGFHGPITVINQSD